MGGFALALGLAAAPAQAASCRDVVKKLADITVAQCEAAELRPSGGMSQNGTALVQRDVVAPVAALGQDASLVATSSGGGEAGANNAAKPLRVLVLGGIHGDEMSSTALVLRWIQIAQAQPAGVHWRFVPLLNPDGLLRPKPTRTNARGVDLNRNFPTHNWEQLAPVYWEKQTRKDVRRWPGPAAKSEPETRFVVDTIEQWQPDLIVSVHAPYAVLDFDGPHVPPQKLGRFFLDRVGVFPGSLGAYGGNQLGVPVVTLELANAYRLPPEAEVKQMWDDLLRWVDQRLMVAQR